MISYNIPHRLVLLGMATLLTGSVFAQKVKVGGQVLDQNQEPLIGATVRVVGANSVGAVTDLDGRFSLEADKNAKLEISYIGFKTQEVKASPDTKVVLREEMNTLGEFVAIGYAYVRRGDVTTAVSSISAADLDTRPIVSAASGMQGKAAGLMISQANGQPGSSPTIRVRGTTSLNGSNDPLYVVDGVPVDNIDFLSPDDIDNMQVLKDASSAAIYGSRAANGVIIINTKQGKNGVAKVSFNAHYTFNGVRDNQDPLNTTQYEDLINDMNEEGVLSLNLPKGLTDQTDWKKEVYRTGHVQDYQASVTNGNDKLRYYLSGGYTGEDGVIRSSSFKRYNVRGSIDNDVNKWLNINASVNYADYTYKGTGIISGTTASRGGVIPSILATPTYAPIWDPENPGQFYNNFYGANADSPLENIARTENNKNQYNKLLMTGKATIMLLPELKYTSSLSFDRNQGISTNFLDPHKTREGRNQNGTGYDGRQASTVWTFDNTIDWKKKFGLHDFDVMLGSSWTHSKWSQNYINASDYANDDIRTLNGANKISWNGTGSSASEWSIMSYFARVQYNLNSTYMITFNLRADGSSRLAPGHKWGYFPSFSGAWRMSNEKFMKNIKWINDLKIRGGWGQTGNQSGLGDYAYLAMYNFNRIQWWESGNERAVPTRTQSSLANPDLTWETTTQTDLGFDLTFLNNRLTLYADWYYKKTTDLIMNMTLPAGSAAATSLARNGGSIVNKGMEFTIKSHTLTGAFKWDTDFNISFNRNELKSLSLTPVYWGARTNDNVNQYVVRNAPGQPLGSFWGYICDGVNPETGDLIYRDVNGDGEVTSSDRTYIGDPNPDFTFGLTNTFTYKGFSLSILLQGSVGNDIYNVSRMESEGMFNSNNQDTGVLRRWRIPGQITDVPRVGFNQQNSSYYIEDGSYLRVKDISLSYDIPKAAISKIHLTRLTPYVSFTNLITWTGYSGRDPEVNQAGNSGSVQGIDWGTYPLCRSFAMGVKVEF
jgi:TonB-linked SusC/RagA family outer membrane protein